MSDPTGLLFANDTLCHSHNSIVRVCRTHAFVSAKKNKKRFGLYQALFHPPPCCPCPQVISVRHVDDEDGDVVGLAARVHRGDHVKRVGCGGAVRCGAPPLDGALERLRGDGARDGGGRVARRHARRNSCAGALWCPAFGARQHPAAKGSARPPPVRRAQPRAHHKAHRGGRVPRRVRVPRSSRVRSSRAAPAPATRASAAARPRRRRQRRRV